MREYYLDWSRNPQNNISFSRNNIIVGVVPIYCYSCWKLPSYIVDTYNIDLWEREGRVSEAVTRRQSALYKRIN